jgi:large subunit ribosomal protein L22
LIYFIRGEDVQRAADIITGTEREAAEVIGKVLTSAVANAAHNDQQSPDDLYVSACYADEGATMKRWRPRARGRATRIRKRTCHITVIVSRLPDDELRDRRARQPGAGDRRRRVAGGRRARQVVEDAVVAGGEAVEKVVDAAEHAVEGADVAPATGDTAEAEVAAEAVPDVDAAPAEEAAPAAESQAEAEPEAAKNKEENE